MTVIVKSIFFIYLRNEVIALHYINIFSQNAFTSWYYSESFFNYQPPKPDQRFLIQFEHLDIPCPQKLTITEADVSMGIFSATVGSRVII